MHLLSQVTLDGKAVPIAELHVSLELDSVGFASVLCPGDFRGREKALARVSLGYAGQGPVRRVLTGLVVESRLEEGAATRLLIRDPGLALDLPFGPPVRHLMAREVLAVIESLCGVSFLMPIGAPYLDVRQPFFSSEGTCRHALDRMGACWSVPDAVWFALPDGRLFWGSWADSPFGKAEPLPIAPGLLQARDESSLRVTLPIIPRMRPGMRLVIDGRNVLVLAVDFNKPTMELKCSAEL